MNEDIVEALNAERYSPVNTVRWWSLPPSDHPETPGAIPDFDDSEIACRSRVRAMVKDFEKLNREATA